MEGRRLSADEGLELYQCRDLGFLGAMACCVKQKKSENEVYFNRNVHIEPTNVCVHHCRFCSYSCRAGEQNSWEKSIEEVVDEARRYQHSDITEIHIVGGVHPDRNLHYYSSMLQAIRTVLPYVHIKALSAVELDYMFEKACIEASEGLETLKLAGLQSIPGGGAEIFDEAIRNEICPEKTASQRWLDIHCIAHRIGILSNATMLYGHIERYEHRIEHMMRLRKLQDQTGGFNAFIPLKYKSGSNLMSSQLREATAIEDMKNYAVSRIFLDNIPHIKAYMPMIGMDMAQLSLAFGADDIDGPFEYTTKIYPKSRKPVITTTDITEMIRDAGYQPVERDSMYRKILSDTD